MAYALLIFAGALLCNCIPHLVAGLQGVPFPSPFATPRGVGYSHPLVNFAWGSSNLVVGVVIVARRMVLLDPIPGIIALAVGFLAAGTYVSLHFGKVRRNTQAGVTTDFRG